MNQWWKDSQKFLKWILYFIIGMFVWFIFNQLMTTYQFFSRWHWGIGLGVILILSVAVIYFGIKIRNAWHAQPQVLELKANPSPDEYQVYLQKMKLILKGNDNLSDFDFEQTELPLSSLIDQAMLQLKERSLPIIKENANAIFLSTAISQNGALDSLVILFSLLRMVWQLMLFYQTRPTLKGAVKLYLQVAGVVLMARTLEETDLIEGQMEPLIASIIGESIASAIPGMVPITNLVVSSLMQGSINAFLTLRVGIITQAYLGMTQYQSRKIIRRSAALQSLSHMGSIIKENSKVVVKSVAGAVKNASKDMTKKWFFERG